MTDKQRDAGKKPGEKPEGEQHYNPGNMSGKTAKIPPVDGPHDPEHKDGTRKGPVEGGRG